MSKAQNWGGNHGGTGGISKASIAAYVEQSTGLSLRESKKIVDSVIATITAALHSGDSVTIHGFGEFYPYRRKRRHTNFKNGEWLEIDKVTAKFKPSRLMLNLVDRRSVSDGR